MRKTDLLSTISALLLLLVGCNNKENIASESYINDGWQLASSSALGSATGEEVSNEYCSYDQWNPITIPSTVLSGLRQNGEYQDIYVGNNMQQVPTEQFKESWWYRKSFTIEAYEQGEYYELLFEGLNYSANIWVNGQLVASRDQIEGPYAIHKLDITPYAKAQNTVAVEVFPPKKDDLTIGFVDWNPNTPDNNMGLWRGVQLIRSNGVRIENIAIASDINFADKTTADLSIDTELKNLSDKEVSGTINVTIEENIKLSISYILAANETKRFSADATDYPQLHIDNPRLWWPIHMGSPELYNATIELYADGKRSFSRNERFGIRKVEDYTFIHNNGDTVRGYKINNQKTLLRGGGWVDDMMLADSKEKVRAQVEYVKHMNLNLIRLEGFWGNSKELYNACDEEGILLMIGLSCQWEWESYCGRPDQEFMSVTTPEDIALISRSYQDQVKWAMNNPSIILWVYGSDKLPSPALEKSLNAHIKSYDKERCILASCKARWQETPDPQTSSVSGSPGVKMLGPYEYVPPVYWYTDNHLGGAYGFNTETGPGAQVPPIESIKKMLAPEDINKINEEGWQYHCGRNQFKDLTTFLDSYNQRYWETGNAEQFAFDVQISNYEAIRAMYEAFEVNRTTQATGIVQWMLNSAWPEMYWQLYDWYLNPNGAFYGTKAALQPLNLIYNYGDKAIYWTNNTPDDTKLTATIEMFDINSKRVFSTTTQAEMKHFSADRLLKLTEDAPSDVYFLSLKLTNEAQEEVSNNFYWLSKKEDTLNNKKSTWFYTPQHKFASFKSLKTMKCAEPKAAITYTQEGDDVIATVTLENPTEQLAFFNELRIVDGTTQETILPVRWSDNYVTILPNETRTLTARLKGNSANMELLIKGFNR